MNSDCFEQVAKSIKAGCDLARLEVPEVQRDDLLISIKKMYKYMSEAPIAYNGIFLTKAAYVGPIWPEFS